MGKRTKITVLSDEQRMRILSDVEARAVADLVKYHLSLGKKIEQALKDANVTVEQFGQLDAAFYITAYKWEGLKPRLKADTMPDVDQQDMGKTT